MNGKSILKRRILKQLGWNVVHIDYKDWANCRTNQEKKIFLEKVLNILNSQQRKHKRNDSLNENINNKKAKISFDDENDF